MSVWNRHKAKVHIADQIINFNLDLTVIQIHIKNQAEEILKLKTRVKELERQNGQ